MCKRNERRAGKLYNNGSPGTPVPGLTLHFPSRKERPIMSAAAPASHESFDIQRHGEIAVVTPSARVEEMHETMIEKAARMVIQSLRTDPPAGIVVDLSQV